MNARREIHGLDYAICVLVSILDKVFRGRCDWWTVGRGLDIEILDRQDGPSKDVLVQIRPVGWRKDEYIVARCHWGGGEWYVFEGHVDSLRLPGDLGFQFGFQTNWPFTLKPLGDSAEHFLREAMPGWFKKVS